MLSARAGSVLTLFPNTTLSLVILSFGRWQCGVVGMRGLGGTRDPSSEQPGRKFLQRSIAKEHNISRRTEK